MDTLGIDLDNTLIHYDAAWIAGLKVLGLSVPPGCVGKRAVRDHLRAQTGGEDQWQSLQAYVYGPGLAHARLAPGAAAFLRVCRVQGVPVYIVSHKTAFATAAPDGTNLQDAARTWLRAQGIVGPQGLLPESQLCFEATREEKAARIASIGCTFFIDDLEETFADAGFPSATKPFLYAPDGRAADNEHLQSFRSWMAIAAYFDERWAGIIGTAVQALTATLGTTATSQTRIMAGRNSRVHRLTLDDGRACIAKQYGHHDAVHRLATEFGAFQMLRGRGRNMVPLPLARDETNALALYEYIPGDSPNEVPDDADVEACAVFIRNLAAWRSGGVPWTQPAREAMTSFTGLLSAIDLRRKALVSASGDTPLFQELERFFRDDFDPVLQAVQAWSAEALHAVGLDLEHVLPESDRVLSPSDFGLHNAIRKADGTLCFIDFEYFGWDDPVKLVADFLLHPAMPLSDAQRRAFVAGVQPVFRDSTFACRLPMAYALFGLKWCMILLNEFLPQHRARRQFAGEGRDAEALCAGQLVRAQRMLARVKNHYREFPYL